MRGQAASLAGRVSGCSAAPPCADSTAASIAAATIRPGGPGRRARCSGHPARRRRRAGARSRRGLEPPGHALAQPQRRVVVAEIDPDHHPAAADLGHLGHRGDRLQQVAQETDLGLQAATYARALERLEARERGGTRQQVAGERVPVEERAVVCVLAEEAVVDPLGGQRRGEQQVPGRRPRRGQSKSGATRSCSREHRPCAPEPRRDLVADQQHVVAVAQLAHARRYPGGWTRIPAAPWTSGSTTTAATCSLWRPSVRSGFSRVARVDLVGVEQQRPVGAAEEIDPAHRHRAEGVAVVRVAQGDERRAAHVLPARWCQYWNAIFSATSVAVEPESEQKTRSAPAARSRRAAPPARRPARA